MIALVAVVVGSIFFVLLQFNSNELISRVMQTTPERFTLDWGFVKNAAQYTLPIILVAIAQFSGRLRSMLEPLVELSR